jgi:ABC-type Fe2+-enterobactin transport system substrate-binding protein
MARSSQPDLVAADSQPGLFGGEAASVYRPDTGKVRARLHKILAEARAAQTLPSEPARVLLYRTIFPQMTLWRPEDEGAQLRFAFETEMARLKGA